MSGAAVAGVALSVSVSRCCALASYGRRRSSLSLIPRYRNDQCSLLSATISISRRRRSSRAAPLPRATPYEVLGVPPSASPQEIKRAYRRLALRFHPDVNKDPRAQETFMRIKHAYNTLISNSNSSSSNARHRHRQQQPQSQSQSQQDQDDDFYGLADFLRDLQEEFRNWEADFNAQEKPKSLWEELSAIGEEFVDFLEKELNVKDPYVDVDSTASQKENPQETQPSVQQSIDEVEAALAQLKKELGL